MPTVDDPPVNGTFSCFDGQFSNTWRFLIGEFQKSPHDQGPISLDPVFAVLQAGYAVVARHDQLEVLQKFSEGFVLIVFEIISPVFKEGSKNSSCGLI